MEGTEDEAGNLPPRGDGGVAMFSHTGRLHRLLFPSLVWKMNSPSIFLTFDDGPHPVASPRVLEVLHAKKAKATFFLSGSSTKRFPAVVRDIAAEGHGIGIHGFNHSRNSVFSRKRTTREILSTEEEIRKIVPGVSRIFRPPYGFFSWNTIAAAKELDYKLVMWSTLTGDFRTDWPDEKVVATAIARLSPGSILVFHDSASTQFRIARVLSLTINYILDHGYAFGVIS